MRAFRPLPQGYSKGTQTVATAAQNVAKTALSRAFKNTEKEPFQHPENLGKPPFLAVFDHHLLTLNLNPAVFVTSQCFQALRVFCHAAGTLKALYFVVHSIIRDSAFSPITTKSPRTIP